MQTPELMIEASTPSTSSHANDAATDDRPRVLTDACNNPGDCAGCITVMNIRVL